jgi:hypothetical protein
MQNPVDPISNTGRNHDPETLYDDRDFELNNDDSVEGVCDEKILLEVSGLYSHIYRGTYVEEGDQVSNINVPLVGACTLHVHHNETDAIPSHSIWQLQSKGQGIYINQELVALTNAEMTRSI